VTVAKVVAGVAVVVDVICVFYVAVELLACG